MTSYAEYERVVCQALWTWADGHRRGELDGGRRRPPVLALRIPAMKRSPAITASSPAPPANPGAWRVRPRRARRRHAPSPRWPLKLRVGPGSASAPARPRDRGRYRERPPSSVWLTQPHIQMLLRFREPDCPVSRPRSTAVAHQATPLSPSAPRRAYESARPETVCGREREPRL